MSRHEYEDYYTKVPNRVISDTSLLASEKLVYAAIRSFGDWKDGSNCYPSIQHIAERAAVSKKTVSRAIRALKAREYLEWTRGRTNVSNRYLFPIETPTTDHRPSRVPYIGSPVTNHQSQAEIYNQRKDLGPTLVIDGYQNCKSCYQPEGMCLC